MSKLIFILSDTSIIRYSKDTMQIIGHRGAAGLAPENTLEAMRAGIQAGADMLEFDVRLTSDGQPVIIHDASLLRTHHKSFSIGRHTLSKLRLATQHSPVPTLQEVLDAFFGKIVLNIELKSKGSGVVALEYVTRHIKQQSDWQQVLFSSFHTTELEAVRRSSKHARLALLHKHNPFAFVTQHKKLNLSAVGFFHLTVNPLAVGIAKKRGIFTYAYTVNNTAGARLLKKQGIDGIVTNYPNRF